MRLFLIFSFILIAFMPAPSLAQDSLKQDRLVKIRILPEKGTVRPNEEIWIGIEQSIKPGWHTYWKNPGDSGTQTRTDWTLPKAFEISHIYWPTPKKLPYGPLLNYGYSDHVILLQKLKVPETLPEGPFDLAVNVELLVCQEECIPEFGLHKITLNGEEGSTEDNSRYLQEALKQLPENAKWDVSYEEVVNGPSSMLRLTFPLPQNNFDSFDFFPLDWGVVNNAASITTYKDGNDLILEQPRGDRNLSALKTIKGVLTAKDKNGDLYSFNFRANPLASDAAKTSSPSKSIGVLHALLLAFLGGLILNLMPCVFPILSMKALSLAKSGSKNVNAVRIEGLAYTLGIILSFLLLAGLLLTLKFFGAEIGWGFQLQNPIVVSLLAYLLFIIGLNLSGYFEINGGFINIGGKLVNKGGTTGAFFTGILATIVATPCTAPFMGVAIGFALVQPAAISLLIFAILGLGLALPYLLISFIPAIHKLMPKPGIWMKTFKEFLAFPMFASCAWLIWVIAQQANENAVLQILAGLIAITMGLWFLRLPQQKGSKKRSRLIAFLLFISALLVIPAQNVSRVAGTIDHSAKTGVFSEESLNFLLENGDEPIFVEMTASWCITCKVNHAVAINTASTQKLFAEHNIQYLIGDWTNQDAEITKYLESHGRNGVPLYVYYHARDTQTGIRPPPVILPQLLTPGTLKEIIAGNPK